ncbi:hypothetical protein ACQYWQ_25025 [Streptomyces sp. P6-2-1]|uniref:hypothetical protein n=1 Tax=Streptomyces sp. P6-2-1 TaxID=3422591 RepID=UPI003D36A740
MSDTYCPRCDLVVGRGCACPEDGSTPRKAPESRPVRQEWRQFPGTAILIRRDGKAHVPGACDHMSEDDVRAPRWGWILDPPPGLWERIKEGGAPVAATGGNTAARATSRCLDCVDALG